MINVTAHLPSLFIHISDKIRAATAAGALCFVLLQSVTERIERYDRAWFRALRVSADTIHPFVHRDFR